MWSAAPDPSAPPEDVDSCGVAVVVEGVSSESESMPQALVELLSSASDLLSSSLAPEDAVRSFGRLVVPLLADWSVVTLVDEQGRPRDVESWHREPSQRQRTAQFARHRLAGRVEPLAAQAALRKRQPFVLSHGAKPFTQRSLRSPAALAALAGLGLESLAVVPVLADCRVVGLITLARGPERPAMSRHEIEAAVDLSRRASITLRNARSFERERSMSEMLQLSMLSEPVQIQGLEVVVRYEPAADVAQVGGDWYDTFTQSDGSTVMVIGDVVGHDLAAAAVMGQLRSITRGIGVTTGSGPAQLLGDVDHAIELLHLDTSATIAAIRVDHSFDGVGDAVGSSIRYSNAGHPPPALVDDQGDVTMLSEHDLLLGLEPGWPRRESSVVLEPGSTLLMYTDGLVERRHEHFDTGLERFKSQLSDLHALPLPSLVDQLIKHLVPEHPDDDVAVLALRALES